MRNILLTNTAIGVLASLLLSFWTKHAATSLFFGSLFMSINVLIIWWSWRGIFDKKLIALRLFVIVSKYGIFGLILYQAFVRFNADPIFLVLGSATFVPSLLICAKLA
jgi:hypothetical protein